MMFAMLCGGNTVGDIFVHLIQEVGRSGWCHLPFGHECLNKYICLIIGVSFSGIDFQIMFVKTFYYAKYTIESCYQLKIARFRVFIYFTHFLLVQTVFFFFFARLILFRR